VKEKCEIKFEYDRKTKLLTKMELPADLPAEQRIGLEIPFISSLIVATQRLDKHSRILKYLTIALVVLTTALVILSCLQIAR
jgi:hypothetical protein